MVETITWETKKEGQIMAKRWTTCNYHRGDKKGRPKNGQKTNNPQWTKKMGGNQSLLWKEVILLTSLLTSPTWKSWDLIVMGGLKHAPTNVIFFFIAEAKACWKAILTHYLKNWMQKDKYKWLPNHLSWKRQAHFLMKQSISHSGAPFTSMAIKIKWCPSWGPLYLRILTMH
jgi:hypothetical protein